MALTEYSTMSGDAFQMAIAYPLKNHKFRIGTLFNDTLETGGGSDEITVVNPYKDTRNIIAIGDVITIENSAGTVAENLIVRAVQAHGSSTKTTIVLTTDTTISYNGGTITVRGSRLADSWIRTADGTEDRRARTYTIKPIDSGLFGSYAQIIGHGSTQNASHGIRQTLDATKFDPFAYYRFVLHCRGEIKNLGSNPVLKWQVHDSQGTLSAETIMSTDKFEWQRFESTSVYVRNVEGGTDPYIDLLLTRINSSEEIEAQISDAAFEHARGIASSASRIKVATNLGGSNWSIELYDVVGTDDFDVDDGDDLIVDDGWSEIRVNVDSSSTGSNILLVTAVSGSSGALTTGSTVQVENNGYVDFGTDVPVEESLRYSKIDNSQIISLPSGSGRRFNPVTEGDKGDRWIFQCRFNTFSDSLWKKLQKFLRWQENGALLNLHPFIPGVPPVMTGILQISEYSKGAEVPFLTFHDFDFTFIEM